MLLGVLFDRCAIGQKHAPMVEERGTIWEDGRPCQSFSIPQRVSDGVYGHLKKNRHVDFSDC